MKYITEMSHERLEKLGNKLPINSALISLDDCILATNVSSILSSIDKRGGVVELGTARDKNGRFATQIDRNLAARKLYKIAEPDGISWFLAPSQTREKYIRMQDAGVKP